MESLDNRDEADARYSTVGVGTGSGVISSSDKVEVKPLRTDCLVLYPELCEGETDPRSRAASAALFD